MKISELKLLYSQLASRREWFIKVMLGRLTQVATLFRPYKQPGHVHQDFPGKIGTGSRTGRALIKANFQGLSINLEL